MGSKIWLRIYPDRDKKRYDDAERERKRLQQKEKNAG
jgi:hypothetical protein